MMSRSLPRRVVEGSFELLRRIPRFTKSFHGDLLRMLSTEHRRLRWLVDYNEFQLGGAASYAQKRPLGPSEEPIPWYTYPAIEFLSQIDFSGGSIFEFGSGNSSAWWSVRAKVVVSVESDPAWHAEVSRRLKPNQTLLLETDKFAYANSFLNLSTEFDVIVVDGVHRRLCVEAVLKHRAPQSIIIFDNSDWWPLSIERLTSGGKFQQIDFIGTTPINCYSAATSIFVPDGPTILLKRLSKELAVIGGIKQVDSTDSEVP